MAKNEVEIINGRTLADVTAREAIAELKQYSWVSAEAPLVLFADKLEDYNTMPVYGDRALKAIQEGRQILVRTPNADGGNYTAIYSPVLMYQLPNYENNYLYLFYLRDEKQDLSALLGQAEGTIAMPQYGELKMLLSETYNGSPLGQPYINTSPVPDKTVSQKVAFFVSAEDPVSGLGVAVYNDNPTRAATVEELVDLYVCGAGFFVGNVTPQKLVGFSISSSADTTQVSALFSSGYADYSAYVANSTMADFESAFAKYGL